MRLAGSQIFLDVIGLGPEAGIFRCLNWLIFWPKCIRACVRETSAALNLGVYTETQTTSATDPQISCVNPCTVCDLDNRPAWLSGYMGTYLY